MKQSFYEQTTDLSVHAPWHNQETRGAGRTSDAKQRATCPAASIDYNIIPSSCSTKSSTYRSRSQPRQAKPPPPPTNVFVCLFVCPLLAW